MESRKNEMDDRVFSASIVISCIINKPINGKNFKIKIGVFITKIFIRNKIMDV